jgi:hypothetical protein
MASEETAWEVARLNRLRSNDSLQPGMLLKIVVADDRPMALSRRRLDIGAERPPSPPPLPRTMPPQRSRVPYPR